MKKKQKNLKLKVLFNASVVLAGLKSPKGGSGRLLELVKEGIVEGKISEIIFDEILKHSQKLTLPISNTPKEILNIFKEILPAPNENVVNRYKKIVIDEGDAHVLASCEDKKIKILVTLDKKHLLILKGKIKGLKIMTPGELIELLKK